MHFLFKRAAMPFYVYKDGSTYGPMEADALREYINYGTFALEDPACQVGEDNWVTLADCLDDAQAEELQSNPEAAKTPEEESPSVIPVSATLSQSPAVKPTEGASPFEPDSRLKSYQDSVFESLKQDESPASRMGIARLIIYVLAACVLCALSAGLTWITLAQEPEPVSYPEPLAQVFSILNRDPRVLHELGSNIRPASETPLNIDAGASDIDLHLSLIGSEEQGRLKLRAIRDGAKWRFPTFELSSAEGAIDEWTLDLFSPEPAERERLVKRSILRFQRALNDDDFSAFYESLHPDFQAETTAGELARSFAPFRNFNFGSIDRSAPVFTSIQMDSRDLLLLLEGYYDLPNYRLLFTVSYMGFPERELRGISLEGRLR